MSRGWTGGSWGRRTKVRCLDIGQWVHPDFRRRDGRAKCGNCGNVVGTVTGDDGVVRYAVHRYWMLDLTSVQMAEMRQDQPERFT